MTTTLLNPGCGTCYDCDDETCICNIEQTLATPCECLKEDYGPLHTAGNATITIAGSITPPGLNAGGSCVSDYIGPTPPSINGSYIISCGDDICYWHSVYAGCTLPFSRYAHYFAVVRLEYLNADYIRVTLEYYAASLAISTTPYPTITEAPCAGPYTALSGHHAIRILKHEPTGTLKRWLFTLEGDCKESCNEDGPSVSECRNGTIVNTSDVSTGTIGPVDGLTVTVSVEGP